MELQVLKRDMPDRFMIIPDLETFFGEVADPSRLLDVIDGLKFADIAEIRLIRLGAFALRFLPEGPLASIVEYKTRGGGAIPDYITQNENALIDLRGKRLHFANFVAGAFFGRLAAMRHSEFRKCRYVGMDRIVGYSMKVNAIDIDPTEHDAKIVIPKIRAAGRKNLHAPQLVKPEEIVEVKAFLVHLAARQGEFVKASLPSCMLLNYQAAILHHEQQSGASLSLNYAVAEALIDEIYRSYGLTGDASAKTFAKHAHTVQRLGSNEYQKLGTQAKLQRLADGGFLSTFHVHQFEEARDVRNNLVHRAEPAAVRQAGKLQTIVRDLWAPLLDYPFELVSGWGMRV
jgi:hypothetical protein